MNVISIVTGDPGQVGVSYFDQLRLRELAGVGGAVVPVAVSFHRPLELVSDQTLEGWTHDDTWQRTLTDAADEQVHVINILVNQFQPLNNWFWYQICESVKIFHSFQAAQFSECVVTRHAVVSPALQVQTDEVHPEALVLGLEQVVGHLLRDDVVVLLAGLRGQTHQELVQLAGTVHNLRIKEGVGQWDPGLGFAVVLYLFHQTEKWSYHKNYITVELVQLQFNHILTHS